MSVEKANGAQLLSIHYVSVLKVCRYFSLEKVSVDLRELIVRVVALYNHTIGSEESHYKEVLLERRPAWKVETFEPFTMCIYAQIIRSTSRLSSWLNELGSKESLGVQRVHYLFFLFRERKIGEKIFKEVFALTTGQAFRVVQRFSDYRFPINVARRLMDPEIQKSKKRPIVGSVLLLTEVLKQGAEVSETDQVDKLFARAKFEFRNDSSIFRLSFFQNSKGKQLARGMGAEIGLGLVRFSKEIHPNDFPAILHHLSEIACKQKTYCAGKDKKEEVDSEEFDFLDNFQPTDFTRVPELNRTLVAVLADFFFRNVVLPPFDFCHKHRSDFFQATRYILQVGKTAVATWDGVPMAVAVMTALKKHVPEEKKFADWIDGVRFGFVHQGKTESAPVVDYLEGELRVKTGEVYWRLHTMWFEVHADYLGLVHQEFRKLLEDHLISSKLLPEKWPSPKQREETKKKLGQKKYDIEGEYNLKYLNKEGFIVGDKVCPAGIELGDIFLFKEKEVFFFHVKENFGHQTRDACSQILNAAKMLHHHAGKFKNPMRILRQFYKEAKTKGHVAAQMTISEDKFIDRFADKEFVFVYAVIDSSEKERRLSKERDVKSSLKEGDLEKAHPKFKGKGNELFQELVKEGYLSKRGRITSKFAITSKVSFAFPSLGVKAQRESLYDCLNEACTQFDSTIAKLELLSLRDDLTKLGFKLKILQVEREDYGPEDQAAFVRVKDPQFEVSTVDDLDEETRASIRGDIGEGDSFKVGEEEFDIMPTVGDGACGLHALLGQVKEGHYVYAKARETFVERLKNQKALCEPWLTNFLKDYLGKAPSLYAKMVFEKLDLDDLQEELENLDEEKRESQTAQMKLFTQICDSEECRKALKDVIARPLLDLKINPVQMQTELGGSLKYVLAALKEIELGASLQENVDALKDIKDRREQALRKFIQQPEVWEAYLQALAKKNYYLSTQELQIAAQLFNKHVVIYTHRHLDQVEPALEGGDPANEKIIIFHKGIHFSRCDLKQHD